MPNSQIALKASTAEEELRLWKAVTDCATLQECSIKIRKLKVSEYEKELEIHRLTLELSASAKENQRLMNKLAQIRKLADT